jgi:Ca-activated chloride channel family protein
MQRTRLPFKRRWPNELIELLEDIAAALLLAGIALLLIATLRAQVARAAEFPSDVGAGTLVLQTAAGAERSAPLSTDVQISVAGVVARVAIAQRFRNASAEWVEAVYALPLPDDAAVDTLKMRIGERVIEGEIHEREKAERIYSAARENGQRASLVRQTSANLFTTAVANIAPGEAVDITIEYLQTARYDAGEFSLRIPMTYTRRYGAPDTPEALATATSAAPPELVAARESTTAAAARSTPMHEASVRAVLAPGMPLAAVGGRGHELKVTVKPGADRTTEPKSKIKGGAAEAGLLVRRRADLYVLEPLTPRVTMDRDLVITWRPEQTDVPKLAALTETRGDTTYALLMMLPPAETAATVGAQPREQIFVVDTSGSMGGQSIEQAKAALADALGRLRSGDRFNVFQFNSSTSSLFRAPVTLSSETYAQAMRYVSKLEATGGTEIEPAIRAALAQPVTPGYVRQVIFMTDGGVAGETGLFATIKSNLGNARLFTIGIGSAPNSYFMRKAAQFGRGTFTHIGDLGQVQEKMQALFAKIERLALADVLIDWPESVEFYPNTVPDLYAGEPLVITASFPARPDRPVRAKAFGTAGGAPWMQEVAGMASELPGIATLWARRKIEYLIDSRVDGVSEDLIRKLVVDTALEHHLVSPYTSLVAVDKTPARSAEAALRRQRVASDTPAGAQWTIGLPRTATPAPLLRLVGGFVLLLAGASAVLLCRRALPA